MSKDSSPLVVAVAWNDAHFNSGEFEKHELIHRPWRYVTVGILAIDDETGITLANDVGEDGRFRGTNFVPRAMIVESWPVGQLTKKKRAKKASVPIPASAQDSAASSTDRTPSS